MHKIVRIIRMFFFPASVIFVTATFSGAYYTDNVTTNNNGLSFATWTPGPAVISEVLYNPDGTDTGLEWIKIKNAGTYTIDLDGYVLHFDGTGSNDFTFPDFALLPGSKVVVHVRASGTNTATDLYWVDTGGVNMSNSYGSVVLFNKLPKDSSTIVDFVQYGAKDQDGEIKAVAAGIWTDNAFVTNVAESHSIQLIGADNNAVSDWQDQSSPTPGS